MTRMLLYAAACAAAIASPLPAAAQAPAAPTFRLCTGAETGNYFFAGNVVAKQAGSAAKVTVIPTTGSTQNLDGILSGSCDAAFVQNDALRVYSAKNPRILPAVERSAVLYSEAVHLICNRGAKLGSVMDLKPEHRVAVGDNTGSTVTWDSMVMAAKDTLGKVPTDPKAGIRALNSAADGAELTCVLQVAALNAPLFTQDAQRLSDQLVMVPIDDKTLAEQKDAKGRPIYSFVEIPSGTYKGLMPSGWFSAKAIRTLAVDAVLVVSTSWADSNQRAYEAVLRAVNASMPDIKNRVGVK